MTTLSNYDNASDSDGSCDDKRHQVLILFLNGEKVLLRKNCYGTSALPLVLCEESHPLEDGDEFNVFAAERLGLGFRFHFLRAESVYEYHHCGGDWEWLQDVALAEVLDVSCEAPPGYRWEEAHAVGKQEFEELSLPSELPASCEADESGLQIRSVQPIGDVVRKYCDMEQVCNAKAPWRRPGWYKEAEQWIKAALQSHNISMTGHPVLVCNQDRNIVMKVSGDCKNAYFKQHEQIPEDSRWPSETTLTEYLSKKFPNFCIPKVLRADRTENRLLMEEVAVVNDNGDEARLPDYEEILRTLFELHSSCISIKGELVDASCKYQGLHVLQELFLRALESKEVLDAPDQKTVSCIRNKVPAIMARVEAIANIGLPDTLCHGDMSWPNVAFPSEEGGHYLFFDWECAKISHPFFDVYRIFDYSRLSLAERESMSASYLRRWTVYGHPYEELEAAWASFEIVLMLLDLVNQVWPDKTEPDARVLGCILLRIAAEVEQ